MNRRRLLGLGGAALATAVAGCSGEDGTETEQPPADDAGDESTPTPTTTSESTETPTPTSEATQAATASPTPTASATPTASPTPTPTPTPRAAAQVVAVADGGLSFAPATFEVSTGDTVVWVWHSAGHNVRPASRPRGSTFSGTPGGDGDLYEAGYEYAHTFTVAGEYEYYCSPHRSAGMTGSFTVVEE